MSRPVTPIDSRPSDKLEEGEIDKSMQDIVIVETPLSPPPNSPPRPHHIFSPGSTSPEPLMQLPTEVVTTFNSPQIRGIAIQDLIEVSEQPADSLLSQILGSSTSNYSSRTTSPAKLPAIKSKKVTKPDTYPVQLL